MPKKYLQKHMNISFRQKVYQVVRQIPKGQVLTYKQVAERMGNANAARAVGTALKKNFDPDIPCHRVIRSDGQVGQYNRGATLKQQRLKEEGAI